MSEQLTFLLAVHNHQPVGNFAHVFEQAFRECYLPFFRLLRAHPRIKATVHFSGPLWEAMADSQREAWDLVSELVSRGQIELLGGGFYEPVLTVIPEVDRQGQLRMMGDFLETNFGARPRGIWLTERVWEPSLPGTLAEAGIEYTLLDEEHFRCAGIENSRRIYITEDEGRPLRLFPIDKKLRYLVPFRPIADVAAYLEEVRAGGGLAILGDDGEKFGLWPGTRAWVYDQGWLEAFLRLLESEEGIETRTYSEALEAFLPAERVYLPPASYEEMMEWVLPPEAAAALAGHKDLASASERRFLRGGMFRDFFRKYPESDHLHKRMLAVSRGVHAGGGEEARRELYKSQGNDPYWHGVFGGLYLPHLREAAYEHLLRAERTLPAAAGWEAADLDLDGQPAVVRSEGPFRIQVKPAASGAVTEIDYYPASRNLTDVLSRRPETYHRMKPAGGEAGGSIHELARRLPPGAENLLRYDRRPRFSGLDHFFPRESGPEALRDGSVPELGDFPGRPYAWSIALDRLFLTCAGSVRRGEVLCPVFIQKEIGLEGGAIWMTCTIRNLGLEEIECLYASEWNFYQTPEEFRPDSTGASLLGGRLRFSFEPAAGFHSYPLLTLSQSEKDFDVIHQGFCLLPAWPLTLAGGASCSVGIRLTEEERDV